ncbi:MAG TPA: hypothetical protein DD435_12080 [Cyanobacteria bacterium UBA8530]|nr:hypothetical protein [Cyanobacteria bacterium UBA8530]
MRSRFLLVSFLVHSLLVGLVLAVPARARRSLPPAQFLPEKERVVYTAILKQAASLKAAPVKESRIALTKKKKVKVLKKVAKSQVALKPSPSPSPPPKDEKVAILKKIPYFAGWTEADLKNLELPPGIKDWNELAAVTAVLDKQNWLGAPPELSHQASASQQATDSSDPLAAISDLLAGFKSEDNLGWKIRTVGDRNEMAFQYIDMMFIARWKEGEPVARVFYFPFGGKESDKAFEVPVDASADQKDREANLVAQIIIGYQMAGMPR